MLKLLHKFGALGLLMALIASAFVVMPTLPAEAGTPISNIFTSVNFSCPGTIDYDGQWNSGDFEDAYVRIYDADTNIIIDDAEFYATTLGTNFFSGSFTLSSPLPSTVVIELYTAFIVDIAIAEKPAAPSLVDLLNGVSGGPPVPPDYELQDIRTIPIPACASVSSCPFAFPIYGTAMVLKQQVGFSEPNGEPARDADGDVILLLHDLDNDGVDTYLIVDIKAGADGETWLGLFIGGCNPVYASLDNVYPLSAIPLAE